MIITIEPSDPNYGSKVVITLPHDDVSAEDAIEATKRALVAFGFHWDCIFQDDD